MKKKDLETLEKRLLAERQKRLDEIGHLDKTILSQRGKDSPEEISNLSFHMDDMGSDAMERERAFLTASVEGRALLEVDDALRRLYRDEYGVCETCGEDIAIKRLEAVPQARLCLDCKAKEEKQGRRP